MIKSKSFPEFESIHFKSFLLKAQKMSEVVPLSPLRLPIPPYPRKFD